jgi:predicted RNase H-like HicB family nuclease
MNHYHINVFYSKEDNCYLADVPDLRFCTADGRTPEEALQNVLVAKREWLAFAKEEGKPIPVPTNRVIGADYDWLNK